MIGTASGSPLGGAHDARSIEGRTRLVPLSRMELESGALGADLGI